MKAEIRGANNDDIQVCMDFTLLSMSAEVRKKEAKEGAKLIRCDRDDGSVSRTFTLNESVDQDAAQTKSQNGLLQRLAQKA